MVDPGDLGLITSRETRQNEGGAGAQVARHHRRADQPAQSVGLSQQKRQQQQAYGAAQQQAARDAAEHVDEKWDLAFARADRVRRGYATLLDDPHGDYALAANTHELVIRFLSALPLRERPVLVTTDGEFHTLRRQLDRLAEEGVISPEDLSLFSYAETAEEAWQTIAGFHAEFESLLGRARGSVDDTEA